MKARTVLFDELGGPEVLHLAEVDIGEPGPGQVRVRIDAFGLNRGEVFLRTGRYYYDAILPGSRLGTEAAGVVEAVGPGVTGYAAGDAVSIVAKPNDEGMSVHGIYADRAVVAAERLIRRPEHMDAVTGAAVWAAAFTSYGALVEAGGLRPGDDVVVTAASSGVGMAAVQIAAHLGATPIAVTRTGAKADRLLAAGAAHVITADDDVVKQVHALTGGRGARLVFDGVAGPGLPDLARAVTPDGMLIVYGSLDGRPTPLPMWWPINVYGYAVFHLFADAERLRRAEAFITDGLRAGALAPVIDRTFDLTDIVEAHRYMESNTQVGKIVVTVQH
ncbi:zinc-binding dehydrogenase [Nonomuraea phyllanthi]|uniref:zinc-dependent alcohol dehydrogenase family protein n=1 Tax=Nonomuraea phyllanthi TaxID=2219224 RepID=UPI001293E589|nr:zinc-dependent alcohol dehydrogenase family protein [Nonomuraea phyllanthi]QFY06708.1 zinc-binding dehydrogenase [Nonomuraea phyllanthi]